MVERYVWDVDVAGSNPVTPTIPLGAPPAGLAPRLVLEHHASPRQLVADAIRLRPLPGPPGRCSRRDARFDLCIAHARCAACGCSRSSRAGDAIRAREALPRLRAT